MNAGAGRTRTKSSYEGVRSALRARSVRSALRAGNGLALFASRRRGRRGIALDDLNEGYAVFRQNRLFAWNQPFLDLLRVPAGLASRRTVVRDFEHWAGADGPLGDLAARAAEAHAAGRIIALTRRRADGAALLLRYRAEGARAFTLLATEVSPSPSPFLLQARKFSALGQVIDGIAHDFNNDLAVVLMNLDGLRQHGALLGKEARRIEIAINAAQRSARLVQHLLAFSRKTGFAPEVVYLPELMPRLIELSRHALGDDIVLDYDCAERLATTRLDPAQFEVAVLGLILGARDAMAGRGRLRIAFADAAPEDGLHLHLAYEGLAAPDGEAMAAGLDAAADFMRQIDGRMTTFHEAGNAAAVTLFFRRDGDGVAAGS